MKLLAAAALLLVVAGCGSSVNADTDPLENSHEQPTRARIWDPENGVRCYIIGENTKEQSMSCMQNQSADGP